VIALETAGLGKRYGRTWALEDCSLQLEAGRVAALVGPNGAGKTTLLHVVTGFLRPTTGSVHVLGASPVEHARDVMPRVGFVAQDHPLYHGFTVAETLTLGRKLNPRWDDRLPRDRIDRLRIPLDRPVGKLSGGQRAQVALAVALGKRPELLVLDEPLASLDPLARREFLGMLMEVAAETGVTVLLSSHDLADMERVCDHLIVIRDARVRLVGDIADVVGRHRRLIGPRLPADRIANVERTVAVSSTERQTTVLAQLSGPVLDPRWEIQEVSLEDVVLAYLGRDADERSGRETAAGRREDLEVLR
jgi:ABC-2 type transport system ATP-binding protein